MAEAARGGASVIPVDSEHSAIFQAMRGNAGNRPRKLLLTSSGGPFRGFSRAQLESATPRQALAHPNWKMGDKITIDSATMMNKGLEIIEACHLFGMRPDEIEVLVHPQCVVHSMVEFADGSVIAQLGAPDMRVPISYALSFPERWETGAPALDFIKAGPLAFEPPDEDAFPCVRLAREAMSGGRSYPAALNAANEAMVGLFLAGGARFLDIPRHIAEALERHDPVEPRDIWDVLDIDREVKAKTLESAMKAGRGREMESVTA
jgi:1-deoxy-D-xylulose-5-phosphate reductoisomerase